MGAGPDRADILAALAEGTDGDLAVLLRGEVILTGNVDRILHEFAYETGEQVLDAFRRRAGAEPPWELLEAIAVKRRWLIGQATDTECIAAGGLLETRLRTAFPSSMCPGINVQHLAIWNILWLLNDTEIRGAAVHCANISAPLLASMAHCVAAECPWPPDVTQEQTVDASGQVTNLYGSACPIHNSTASERAGQEAFDSTLKRTQSEQRTSLAQRTAAHLLVNSAVVPAAPPHDSVSAWHGVAEELQCDQSKLAELVRLIWNSPPD
jgi:hypothetical protein